ncbi:MAG: hypothetical protein ISS77_03965 [Phycisphaerae bacterium]|nr:hypothetical protein [Phycisphaerae bacterium]
MKSKRVWAARLLALLVMSFGLSLLVSIDSANKMPYTKRIEIKANNNVEEIINAV